MLFSTKYMGIYGSNSSFYNQMQEHYIRFLSWKEPKTYFYNDFISSVAYNIYKYKMTAIYEKNVENKFGLRKYLKMHLFNI